MEEDVEIALDIVVNEIANVTNKYAVCKDSKKNSIYKAKGGVSKSPFASYNIIR